MVSLPSWLPGPIFLLGGLCQDGASVLGTLFRRVSESKKRTVCILLECFLVEI